MIRVEQDLMQRCRALLSELGIAEAGRIRGIVSLSGGVASDIAVVDLGNRKVCAKFALPKLKVAEEWHAPLHRNRAEYEWLRVAGQIAPENAVRLMGCSDALHGFVMAFLDGENVSLWKSQLLAGHVEPGAAAAVGDVMGRIQSASTARGFDVAPFRNRDDFRALRIEPYLTFTATRWPDLAPQLHALADMLFESDQVLVHGDASPKNILFRDGAPVFLDAECATMGDASFDPAFCMNHLILKAVHRTSSQSELLSEVQEFWAAYARHVEWESVSELEARVCRLLPALMLARVDGKSPVEYLDETRRRHVRALAVPLIEAPSVLLSGFLERVAAALNWSA